MSKRDQHRNNKSSNTNPRQLKESHKENNIYNNIKDNVNKNNNDITKNKNHLTTIKKIITIKNYNNNNSKVNLNV